MSNNLDNIHKNEYFGILTGAETFTFDDLVFSQAAAANSNLVVAADSATIPTGQTYTGTSQAVAVVTNAGGAFTASVNLPGTAGTSGRYVFVLSAATQTVSYIVEYVATTTTQKHIFVKSLNSIV